MPKAKSETSIEQALAALGTLAESDADKARVKGIREWACRKTNTPFHEEIKEKP